MYKTQFDATEKIWSGAKLDVQISKDVNFGEIILKSLADIDSERIMQIDGDTGESWTKAEVHRRTIRCAQNLQKIGCTPDRTIVVIARNHHNLTPLLFASLCIGTPICPLDVFQDGKVDLIKRVEPLLIFCDTDIAKWTQNSIAGNGLNAKIYTVNGNVDGFKSIDSLMSTTGCEDNFVCIKINDSYSHAALLLCSSGSTGPSKIICLSHGMLAYGLATKDNLFEFVTSPKENPFAFVTLTFSSLHWISGDIAVLGSAFKDTRIFTASPFSTDKFFDLVEKYQVQNYHSAPYHLDVCLKSVRCRTANLSSLKLCIISGSMVPMSLVDRFTTLLPHCQLICGYGTTETIALLCMATPKELKKYPNVVGQLKTGVEIKIVNTTTDLKCGIDEEGEIYAKLQIPLMGYFLDPDANRIAFDCDGFSITGDIGYFDDVGRLFLTGRKKEMFKVRNHVIWPSQLEDILQSHEAIRNTCVVGVFDEETSTDLAAAVVEKNEGHSITKEKVYKLISDKLAQYKWLDGGVYFVDELPVAPNGKIMRLKVKDMAQNFYKSMKQMV